MIRLFEQRDFGRKINATFQYTTENFRSLALVLLYIVGPVTLVAGIASGINQSNMLNLARSSRGATASSDPTIMVQALQALFSPALAIAFFFGLLSILAVSVATYAHMKVYVRKTEQSSTSYPANEPIAISVAEVWTEMQPLIGRVIIMGVLGSLVSGFAALFLVIPGIYVAIVLSLGLAVTCFEETDFGQTWSRCFTLIRNNWWSTFGLILVMGIISGIVGLVFTLPAGIIGFLTSAKLLPDIQSFWVVLGTVVSTVGGTLLRSLLYIALGFQYTNLVEQQEGRGLLSAIDSIGTAPSQPRASEEGDY